MPEPARQTVNHQQWVTLLQELINLSKEEPSLRDRVKIARDLLGGNPSTLEVRNVIARNFPDTLIVQAKVRTKFQGSNPKN